MLKLIKRNYNIIQFIFLYAPIILLWALINIACQAPTKRIPTPLPKPPSRLYELPIKIKEPIIRIGLQTDANLIQLTCNGNFQVILQDKSEIIKQKPYSIAHFTPKISKSFKNPTYSIQLGTFSNKENAIKLLNEIKEKFKPIPEIIIEAANNKYKVKLIGIKSKKDTENLKTKLLANGYDVWIISDFTSSAYSPELKGSGIIFYDETGQKSFESSDKILVFPENEQNSILFNSKPYRGGFIVFLNDRGKLNAINILNLEDYLKGVLPLEMGPFTYSAIEALKAQALAARTYAVRNMHQYEKEGYDLCATTACQVYQGSSAEDPLSNKAVDDTTGEIITYLGNPIIALYTSTCGGHTEDGKNIFNLDEPYLQGTPCSYEQQNIFSVKSNNELENIQDQDGYNITSNIFFLYKLGFLNKNSITSSYLNNTIEKNEFEKWINKLRIFLNSQPNYSVEINPDNFLNAVLEIAKAIKADEKARLLFPAQVNETLMNFSDASIADTEAKKIIALFISIKYLKPYINNTLHLYDPPLKYRILDLIFRILEHHKTFTKQTATFIETNNNKIQLKIGPATLNYKIAENILLAHSYGNIIAFPKDIKLATGDIVNYLIDKDEIYYLEVNWLMQGSSNDRTSKYAFWTQFISNEELANKISKIKDIGLPTDLIILNQGVSGRVIELLIKGEKGEIILKGLNIRMTLGLKENWFTIDKVIGNQKGFLFTGRGWGHGVGLCQVGAYGAAVAGKNYREIIKHYYKEVDISKMQIQ